jgi:Ca2+-binding RTX toxin-like protein
MATFFGTNAVDNFPGTLAADTIFGAGGDDNLNGIGGNDNIYGDSGNDLLVGGAGFDFIYGGEGDDILNATLPDDDNLFGGIGNDVYQVSRNTDTITEGFNQGIDTVRSSVTNNLLLINPNLENLLLTGAANIDGTGNSLDNQITGNAGNNVLNGLNGKDVLTGGGGNDQFIFNTAFFASGIDTINDFVVGSDKIVLDKTFFPALETVAGSLLLATDFAVIDWPLAGEQAQAEINPEEIVYNRQTGNLFYNANDAALGFGLGGGQFATIVGSPDTFSNTDVSVIA